MYDVSDADERSEMRLIFSQEVFPLTPSARHMMVEAAHRS
jgi:hypothetical protein